MKPSEVERLRKELTDVIDDYASALALWDDPPHVDPAQIAMEEAINALIEAVRVETMQAMESDTGRA